jgi:Transglycosylase SLT domain
MRHWFVPACLCLVTWSGASTSDTKLAPDNVAGFSIVDKNPEGSGAGTEPFPAAAENSSSPDPTPTQVGLADIQIDIPMQTAGEQELKPERAPLPPIRQMVVQRSYREVCDTLAKAAQLNGLPAPFFIRLLFQESGFRPEVVSRAGAQGVAQFMPDTSASMGVINPFDPVQAIPASARLLRNLFQQFGNLGLAAAAYNAGPKRIEEWLTKKGKLPQETQGYVKTITGRPVETWKVAEAGNPEMKLPRHAPCQETAGLLAWNGPSVIPMPRPSPFTRTSSAPIRAAVQAVVSVVMMKRSTASSTAIIYVKTPGKALTARGLTRTNQTALRKQPGIEAKLANKLRRHDKTARRPLELAAVAGSSLK